MTRETIHTDEEWARILTPEEYRVLRDAGTEPPFTGEYVDLDAHGIYRCRACGNALFDSKTKYHSGSGWPSFWEPITPDAVEEVTDVSHGMKRTEIRCGKCGSHLGHVFEDGPQPTGTRYCTNSISLDFHENAAE
ncbi:MAG: peptide-methionine (R)-S-oxide reductase MsrB [Actinomycetota bacterium]|nr:MAG: peptide-methionine (R)-S-oxide [Actinomycetota bacterium]MDO8950580.1 peptide-methionine (R)-S-oxide reductase MsrB [Actinomycetota bacterium]MDP3629561.1 peptide-methionine (R)-S-oxide reductase MsrB [Actinomycetota bacterium]